MCYLNIGKYKERGKGEKQKEKEKKKANKRQLREVASRKNNATFSLFLKFDHPTNKLLYYQIIKIYF